MFEGTVKTLLLYVHAWVHPSIILILFFLYSTYWSVETTSCAYTIYSGPVNIVELFNNINF